MATRLIYAGIDEAGYGPLLGPLCVAMSVIEIRGEHARGGEAGGGRPDVWSMLGAAVVREVRDAGDTSIAVNDSKRVKVSGSSKRHPLVYLERAILGVMSCMDTACGTDIDLYRALRTRDEGAGGGWSGGDWYGGGAVALPVASGADQIRLASSRLRGACERGGVSFASLDCRVCNEFAFNDEVRRGGLKSEISFARVGSLMRRVWDEHGGDVELDEFGARVVIDRQGGRIGYGRQLSRVFPGAEVRVLLEHPLASVYDIRDADGRRMRVTFAVKADGEHFPVALASMTAKFVRELAMMRFNRYWCDRISELKPTAGYGSDAKRWLADVERGTTPEERMMLRRMA